MTAPSSSAQPTLAELDYEVLGTLGSGAGSTILKIRDKRQDRCYALKVVKKLEADDEIYVNQAQHEFEVAQKLKHKSIIQIYDCRVRRKLFRVTGVDLLLEWIDGQPIDEANHLDIGHYLIIFIHVTSALSHMHRRGVFHADLKPSNILLSRSGAVKVIDLGTAWLKDQPKERVQGTPEYMAPEQASRRTVNVRTDLYNLGATMYRLLTGKHVNHGMGMAVLGQSFRPESPRELNPEIPEPLEKIVLACLEPSPRDRPRDAHEVREALVILAKQLHVRSEELEHVAPMAFES